MYDFQNNLAIVHFHSNFIGHSELWEDLLALGSLGLGLGRSQGLHKVPCVQCFCH